MTDHPMSDAEIWAAMLRVVEIERRRHADAPRPYTLTPRTLRLLGAIDEPTPWAELVDVLEWTRGNLANALDALKKDDLVTVGASKDDARCKIVRRTDAGEAALASYAVLPPEGVSMDDETRALMSAYLRAVDEAQRAACASAGRDACDAPLDASIVSCDE